MIKEADASSALTARDEVTEKKRSALRLVSSRPAVSGEVAQAAEASTERLPARAIYPAFMVRDERFAALHPRQVLSRLRRRGSYVFHC